MPNFKTGKKQSEEFDECFRVNSGEVLLHDHAQEGTWFNGAGAHAVAQADAIDFELQLACTFEVGGREVRYHQLAVCFSYQGVNTSLVCIFSCLSRGVVAASK